MFVSVCAFSIMDLIVKWSEDYPVGQVLFFRGLCGIIPILFLIPQGRFLNAINIAIRAINPNKHLKKCKPALFV